MGKRQPTENIRVSLRARKMLKVRAAKLGITMAELVDSLLKQ